MTRVTHLSNGKSVIILGTVVGCLIILWPKVFYPMMQGGFTGANQDINLKSKIHPRMIASQATAKGFNGQSNFHGPQPNIPHIEQNSIGGASVGLIMTIYTIGIIFLFFYTIFKYISSDDPCVPTDDDFDGDQTYDNKRKGETPFDKYDHEQGECLKKLAVNYVRCKSKLSDYDTSPTTANDEDGVSMAYRTLLGDMLELRDYLFELQCSVNGCYESCNEFCNCTDEIIDDCADVYESEHDFGFDVGEAIKQMFGSQDVKSIEKQEKSSRKPSDQSKNEESEKESIGSINDLIDYKVDDDAEQLIRNEGSKEE